MLSTWQSPLWQAFTLFLYGLCVGSFTSVLIARIQRREQVVHGRSKCPTCRKELQAKDLVPVLSYLILRGRCRHCEAPIPITYPLLEIGAGLFAGAVALTAGAWAGVLALLLWVIICWLFARAARTSSAGYALTEVVIAMLLLALVLASALDIFALVPHTFRAGERRTQAILLARASFSYVQNRVTRMSPATWDPEMSCSAISGTRSGDEVLGVATLAPYQVTTTAVKPSPVSGTAPIPEACNVEVTVSCPTCSGRFGVAVRPVTIRGLVRVALTLETE